MENLCSTCLERLPITSEHQSHTEDQYTVQCDENFMKILYINTGIAYNNAKKGAKQLCHRCYMKIMAFDEFRDTALCCATALHELILEEDFSTKTLNNLQHFCCTCLSKLQKLSNTTSQLKNIAWKRWLEECIILKERTAVKQWPRYLCDSCCDKLNEFIQFEELAKQSLKKIGNDVDKQENNKEYVDAEKEISEKQTSKIESGTNQISSITENMVKDDPSCYTNYQGNNETNGGFVTEQKIVNKRASEKEYDFNETANTLENTRKWVEKTTENVIIHCKKKRKQRARRKKAARRNVRKSLESLNTLSERNAIEVSANTGKSFRDNTDTCYVEIPDKGIVNNEFTTAKSDELVECDTSFDTLVDKEKEKLMNDNGTLEGVSMSSNNELISNISAAPAIIDESSQSNFLENSMLKRKHSETLITRETLSNEQVKETTSIMSSNESGVNKQPRIQVSAESTADIATTFVEDAAAQNKYKETAISEDDIHKKISSPRNASMISNDNPTCDGSLTSNLLIEGNSPKGHKRKHSDAKSEESNTGISRDFALNQPSTNTSNKETSTNKLPEQDILVEDVNYAHFADVVVNAEMSADIILNHPGHPNYITDVLAQSTTDTEPMHVETVEQKCEMNSEDGTLFKPSSKRAIKKAAKKKQKLQNYIREAEISADGILKQISTESKFPDTLNNNFTSISTSKEEITDETPRNIFFKDVSDIGLNGEKSHYEIGNNSQNSSKNMAKLSHKKSTSKKKPKQDISAKGSAGIGSMQVEDVELKQENRFPNISESITLDQPMTTETVKNPSDIALTAEQEMLEKKDDLPGSPIEETPNKLSLKTNIPEASYNKYESLTDINSTHSEDVALKTDTDLITEDKIQDTNSKSSVNTVFNQLSSTHVISEAFSNNSTPTIPSKEYLSDERPTDILSMHMVDVVVKVQNIDSVVSAGFILKQPSSTTNSTKASYETPTSKDMTVENLKDGKCIHIEYGGCVYTPEAAPLNESSSRNTISNSSKNISMTKNLWKPEISVKKLRNVSLNTDVERVDKKSIQDESSLDTVLNPATSKYNKADTTTSKPASPITLNQDRAVDNPSDTGYKHSEGTWRNCEQSHGENSENATVNEPNLTKNTSKASTTNSKSKEKSKRRDMSVYNLKEIVPIHTEVGELNGQHNYANIFELAGPNQQSPTNTISKSSSNKLAPEKTIEPAIMPEFPSDALIEDHSGFGKKNCERDRSLDGINRLSDVNKVPERLNNNTTEESISNPTGIGSINVEELRQKFDKSDAETSVADNLNEPIPTNNIAEASKTQSPSIKPARAVVFVESPSVDAVKKLSTEEPLNISSSPKEPLKNISAESSTDTDFMHVKDGQLKNSEIDTQNNAIGNLYQPRSTKNIAISSNNVPKSKKSAKRHKLVETPSQIDFRHAYTAELDIQKSDSVKSTTNSAKELDGKLGENIAKPLINQPTSMKPNTSVENSTDPTRLEDVGLKGEQNYADISEEPTFTKVNSTQNMAKLSKHKTMSKRLPKRDTSPQIFKEKHSTRVRNESDKSDIHNFETDSLEKTSSTYIKSMRYKHKSAARNQEKSNFSVEEPNQLHRSRKNISHESNRKIPSNKPTSEKIYKSHANSNFSPYEEQIERNRYIKMPVDSYGNETKLTTKVSMTSSYSKWSNNLSKSDMYVEPPPALDHNFATDPSYYRRDPVSHTPFRNPNASRHYTMPRHPYETHEMSPNSFAPYSMQNYYQCLTCMKTFKRIEHLSNHRRFSPRCSRII